MWTKIVKSDAPAADVQAIFPCKNEQKLTFGRKTSNLTRLRPDSEAISEVKKKENALEMHWRGGDFFGNALRGGVSLNLEVEMH